LYLKCSCGQNQEDRENATGVNGCLFFIRMVGGGGGGFLSLRSRNSEGGNSERFYAAMQRKGERQKALRRGSAEHSAKIGQPGNYSLKSETKTAQRGRGGGKGKKGNICLYVSGGAELLTVGEAETPFILFMQGVGWLKKKKSKWKLWCGDRDPLVGNRGSWYQWAI